jgi:hypothetical protein
MTTAPAYAAVIFSTCPVASTDSQSGATVDRFKPNDYQRYIKGHAQEFALLTKYVNWLFGLTMDDKLSAQIGQSIEDVQFYSTLSPDQTCHSHSNPTTLNQAIFPFARKPRDGSNQYRVRYKLCEYYVDSEKQLPIDDACTVLGRETGYTFTELKQRFQLLNANIENTRFNLKSATYAAGVVASVTAFKVLKVLRLGTFPSLALALVPAGASHYAVANNMTDEWVRDMIDFKGAAEVAITGDLSTSVKINRPIQDFVPYFVRYLETLEDLDAASAPSSSN